MGGGLASGYHWRRKHMTNISSPTNQSRSSLDLSNPSTTIRLFIGAQAIATILTVARNDAFGANAWNDFLILTVFTQSVSLLGIAALKMIDAMQGRSGVAVRSAIAFVSLLLISVGVYEGLLFALYTLEITGQRWPPDHMTTLVRVVIISSVIIAMHPQFFRFRFARCADRADLLLRPHRCCGDAQLVGE